MRRPHARARGRLSVPILFTVVIRVIVPAVLVSPGRGLAEPAVSIRFPVTRDSLANGLRILIAEDHSVPTVSVATFVGAGSRDERPGITGITRLLAHLVFGRDEPYPMLPFGRRIETRVGVDSVTTGADLTAYFDDASSDRLRAMIDFEADRLASLSLTEASLAAGKEGLALERGEPAGKDDAGTAWDALLAALFTVHPYQWDARGTPDDLRAITLEDAREYFRTYDVPANATVVVAGDVRREEALAVIEAAFGPIPRAPLPPPVTATEPEQTAERRVRIRRTVEAPLLVVAYHGARFGATDDPALDLLARILAPGDSSRLERRLVEETRIAARVDVENDSRLDPGIFRIAVRLRPGASAREAEAIVDAESARLARETIGRTEFLRVVREERAARRAGLAGIRGRALGLGRYEMLTGDFENLFRSFDRLASLTEADLLDAAREVLRPSNRAVVVLEPETTDGDGDGEGGGGRE